MIRLFPIDYYDVGGIESYLHDMAAEGYFLKKLGVFAYYDRGEPKKVTYRLEPLMKEETKPNDDIISDYFAFGWHYICTMPNQTFHIYASYDDMPKELHTDVITQSYSYEYLTERLEKNKNINILGAVFYIILMAVCSVMGNFDVKYYVESWTSFYLPIVILLGLVSVLRSVSVAKRIKSFYSDLKSGIPIRHRTRYKKKYGDYILLTVIMLFSISAIAKAIYVPSHEWSASLADYKGNIPTITLEDIEKEPFETEERVLQTGKYNGVDWNNMIEYHWSELAPVMYEIKQNGIVQTEFWNDNSGEYTPSLRTDYYELRFKFLRKPLIENIIDYETELLRYKEMTVEEILNTSFDYAYFVQEGEWQLLFAYKDNKVICVRYHGYGDLRAAAELVAERI